jgi:hypothetical protein
MFIITRWGEKWFCQQDDGEERHERYFNATLSLTWPFKED